MQIRKRRQRSRDSEAEAAAAAMTRRDLVRNMSAADNICTAIITTTMGPPFFF